MHYFIDEAGDFQIPISAGEHRVAVASCVAFTDLAWRSAEAAFRDFKSTLTTKEFARGEPRWHLLTEQHRTAFCDLLASVDGLSFTPVLLDLSHLAGRDDQWLDKMLAKLDNQPDLMVYPTMKHEIRELGLQARNLSKVQHLRIYAWAYCLKQALYHSIIFLSGGPHAHSWHGVSISIDPAQPRTGSREQRVFSIMVLAWLMGWSRRDPFITVEGVHTADHPFVRLYETADGVDLGKLVRANIRWQASNVSTGIQIADLAAGAIYKAAMELTPGSESIKHYASLMRCSFYGPARAPGLFSPLSMPPDDVAHKYDLLSNAIRTVAKSTSKP